MKLNYVSHITKVELHRVCVTDICVCHIHMGDTDLRVTDM